MFAYSFMRIAFVVGVMLAIIIPLLGFNLTVKNLSMTGDALSHTSLTGVALGLVFGVNPLVIALIVCVIANIIIDLIRRRYPKYADVSIAIIFSMSVGLAGILSSFTSSSNFNSYLFGTITLVSSTDMIMCSVLFVLCLVFYFVFSKQIFYSQFDEKGAKISGIKTTTLNFFLTTLTAMVVALSSKIIGSLIVSSLLVLPVVTSMQIFKSYKKTIVSSVIISILSVILGLILSWEIETSGRGLAPGATIVMISAVIFVFVFAGKIIKNMINRHKNKT